MRTMRAKINPDVGYVLIVITKLNYGLNLFTAKATHIDSVTLQTRQQPFHCQGHTY